MTWRMGADGVAVSAAALSLSQVALEKWGQPACGLVTQPEATGSSPLPPG